MNSNQPTAHPLDELVRELTVYFSVDDMMRDTARTGDTSYRPTCRADLDPRYSQLVDLYDIKAQKGGLSKRAYRPTYPARRQATGRDE
jgi:hypothetical protein